MTERMISTSREVMERRLSKKIRKNQVEGGEAAAEKWFERRTIVMKKMANGRRGAEGKNAAIYRSPQIRRRRAHKEGIKAARR